MLTVLGQSLLVFGLSWFARLTRSFLAGYQRQKDAIKVPRITKNHISEDVTYEVPSLQRRMWKSARASKTRRAFSRPGPSGARRPAHPARPGVGRWPRRCGTS